MKTFFFFFYFFFILFNPKSYIGEKWDYENTNHNLWLVIKNWGLREKKCNRSFYYFVGKLFNPQFSIRGVIEKWGLRRKNETEVSITFFKSFLIHSFLLEEDNRKLWIRGWHQKVIKVPISFSLSFFIASFLLGHKLDSGHETRTVLWSQNATIWVIQPWTTISLQEGKVPFSISFVVWILVVHLDEVDTQIILQMSRTFPNLEYLATLMKYSLSLIGIVLFLRRKQLGNSSSLLAQSVTHFYFPRKKKNISHENHPFFPRKSEFGLSL